MPTNPEKQLPGNLRTKTMAVSSFIYRTLRSSFRALPLGLRKGAMLQQWKQRVATRFFCHQQNIYTRQYYENDVETEATASAPVMAESILTEFRPTRLIDLGCGTGALLKEFATRGVEVKGLEYSEAGCKICEGKGIHAIRFDARHDPVPAGVAKADVVVCFEVAEHLPAEFADRLVEVLTSLADTIIFTGAEPGQGGTDHVNEQPHSYWIAKFNEQDFVFLSETSEGWRQSWREKKVASWYSRNVMVFRKREPGH